MKHFKSCVNSLLLTIILLAGCTNASNEPEETPEGPDNSFPALDESVTAKLPLDRIQLPEGFSISIYATVENARSMALSPDGTLFVGNRSSDKVYAVKDTDGDHKADKKWVIASGLNMPNGVAFRDGDLYVAEVSRITRYDDIEAHLDNPPAPVVVNDQFPTEAHHGWKYIAFGPDGKLYVPVGAPCNICEPEGEIYASITRMDPDGSNREIIAHGVRNTVGFTWHPETSELWFTDNNRDYLGNDVPPCELNRLTEDGQHFGYPYCHAGEIADPEFGKIHPCSDFVQPVQKLGPHVAPLGLKFYTATMFPDDYRGDLFIAEHGSWNRAQRIGYRISLIKVEDNTNVTSYTTFASGWLDDETQEYWGRPSDVIIQDDGAMLVSDDHAGVIYRISYLE